MTTALAPTEQATLVPPTLGKTFLAMMAREVRVMRRNFLANFGRVVMQPLLFVFVFAYVMPKIGPSGGGGLFTARGGPTFATILVPGMVGSALIMQGMMAVLFPLIMELSWQRSIDDRVLAPLPVELLALQKITSGALQALIGGVLVFPVVMLIHAKGQAPSIHIQDWPLFIVVLLAGALLSASTGLFLGTIIDPRQMNVVFTLVLLPLMMLGCVYYPWAALDHIRWLQILVLVNPLVYVSEGLRAVLTPQLEHMPIWGFLTFILAGAAVTTVLATRSFRRRVLA